MKEPEEDERIVMVGVSFEEIAAEASLAVKRELDRQIQKVTPIITEALSNGAAALNSANAALVAAEARIKRYRFALYVLIGLCAIEGGFIAMLIIRH